VIITHQVQARDTLYSLAVQYDSTVEAIQEANKMGDSTIVQVGQQLTIPQLTQAP
jgi:LysM repeat protein